MNLNLDHNDIDTIRLALRVAAEQYGKDADTFLGRASVTYDRLVTQFRRQKEEAEKLLLELENL